MKRFIASLFGSKKSSTAVRPSPRLRVEALEARNLLSASIELLGVTYAAQGLMGQLQVHGGENDDDITISLVQVPTGAKTAKTMIEVTYLDTEIGAGFSERFDTALVTSIFVDGHGGNDTIRNNTGWAATLHGGTGNDLLLGGSGADTIRGGDGSDSIYGRAGNDSLKGDAGADLILGGKGNDTLYGGDGNDFLGGESGSDSLYGQGGEDHLVGDVTGLPEFHGSAPSSAIFLSDLIEQEGFVLSGNDMLDGGIGNDRLIGGLGNDSLYGGDGHDDLFGREGDDFMDGGAGNDHLWGEDGDDTMHGGTGDDRLVGGEDFNVLFGGEGADSLEGGNDQNEYYYDLLDEIDGTWAGWLFGNPQMQSGTYAGYWRYRDF